MVTAIATLHIMVCIFLVLIILIQGGENVDIAAAFGGVSQAAFGPRGAISTMARITWVLAGIFVVTSITLAVWATKHTAGSIMEKAPTQQSVPSTPAPAKK
jgi:preprotein translocase subunit SecG